MKKILSLCLSILLLFSLSLCGCTASSDAPLYSEEALRTVIYDALRSQNSEAVLLVQSESNLKETVSNDIDMLLEEFLPAMMVDEVQWRLENRFGTAKINMDLVYRSDAASALSYDEGKIESLSVETVRSYIEKGVCEGAEELSFLVDETSTEEAKAVIQDAYYQSAYAVYFLDQFYYEVLPFSDCQMITLTFAYAENWQDAALVQEVSDNFEAIEILAESWSEDPQAPVYLNFDYYVEPEILRGITTTALAMCESVYLPRSVDSVNSNTQELSGGIIQFSLSQDDISSEEVDSLQAELDAALTQAVSEIRGDGTKSASELVSDTASYLCDNVTYDMEIYDAGEELTKEMRILKSPYGALVKGQTVCTGYARAFSLILNELGVPCCVLGGDYEDEGHEWNAVYVDGEVIYVDVTFADTSGESRYLWMTTVFYNVEPYGEDSTYWGLEQLPAA